MSSPETAALAPEFVALLCCPLCPQRPPLTLSANGQSLDCSAAPHHFPLTEGFPDLRPDDMKAPAPAAQGGK